MQDRSTFHSCEKPDRLRAELPAVENEEAEYLNRVEALSLSRTSLEERARAVADARKELEVRAAAVAQRQELLVNRQNETESRLERLVVERDRARVRREAIEASIAEVDDLTEQEWDRVLDVNTKGVFLCCQAAARPTSKIFWT